MGDIQQATVARDEAIERGWRNAAEQFREYVLQAIVVLSETRDSFTTDDVWAYLGGEPGDLTHDTRALGGAMIKAKGLGLIRPTDRFVNSNRVACHRRPVRVWESLKGDK